MDLGFVVDLDDCTVQQDFLVRMYTYKEDLEISLIPYVLGIFQICYYSTVRIESLESSFVCITVQIELQCYCNCRRAL